MLALFIQLIGGTPAQGDSPAKPATIMQLLFAAIVMLSLATEKPAFIYKDDKPMLPHYISPMRASGGIDNFDICGYHDCSIVMPQYFDRAMYMYFALQTAKIQAAGGLVEKPVDCIIGRAEYITMFEQYDNDPSIEFPIRAPCLTKPE